MTRKEKYQYLRSIGLNAELSRKWRDRKIINIETKNKEVILRNNRELKKEYNNYMRKKRYHFLRSLGLDSKTASRLRNKKINVEKINLRKNKVVKDPNYFRLINKVREKYPNLTALSLKSDINKYVKKYKNVENYGVYTKWGTLTRISPYKDETYALVNKIKRLFNANDKQAFYILYLMYEHGQSLEQIIEIIQTDPLYEIYRRNR